MRMAVMPTYQIYPQNSFLMDSISKFHLSKAKNLCSYTSSVPSKNQFYCTNNRARQQKNPRKGLNLLANRNGGGLRLFSKAPISSCRLISSRSSWLDDWNVAIKPIGGKRPQAVVNYRNRGDVSSSDAEEGTSTSTNGSTMERIVEKLKKYGYMDDASEERESSVAIEKGSIEDIFYVEDGLLPDTRGGFSKESPLGFERMPARGGGEVRFPWEKNVPIEQTRSLDSRRNRSLAELTLPASEVTRLRNLALRIKNKMKVGGAGVTQQVVETIHEKWKASEVVRLKVEGPPALNMKRMHDIFERKTGGLVIWRSGTSLAIYRGVTYEHPAQKLNKKIFRRQELPQKSASAAEKTDQKASDLGPIADTDETKVESVSIEPDKSDPQPASEVKYEDEIDELLDSLGPRYADWPGDGPLPVDADLLPGIVPGFQPPFRLLPYGIRSTLSVKEATSLRRLARVLPPHFALGRSRQHQGLAAAMIKLWERSSIAKIALKRGVQLTTSERMAEDLKRLTGGLLISRNKDYLVYYRGKNFLSPDVAEALLEKERLAKALQDEEEKARLRASTSVTPSVEETRESGTAGTLKETLDANTRWGKQLDGDLEERMMREAELLRHANLVRKLDKKLAFAEKRLTKAESALSKVEEFLNPADGAADMESLTDEERYMFRKLGLRMKAFLLLGRRGVFSGTVENMHLHWKYRELVKIVVKAPNIEEVRNIALSLEAESGGVLVSVDKISKGYAIIVYRGRDYTRPSMLRPRNLLTKRKALARSIELQRRQDLLNHVSTLLARVNQLRSELEQMASVKERGDKELYNKLDLAYLTEDDSEDDEDGNYLENSDTESDIDNGNNDPFHSNYVNTNFPYGFQDELDTESAETKDTELC